MPLLRICPNPSLSLSLSTPPQVRYVYVQKIIIEKRRSLITKASVKGFFFFPSFLLPSFFPFFFFIFFFFFFCGGWPIMMFDISYFDLQLPFPLLKLTGNCPSNYLFSFWTFHVSPSQRHSLFSSLHTHLLMKSISHLFFFKVQSIANQKCSKKPNSLESTPTPLHSFIPTFIVGGPSYCSCMLSRSCLILFILIFGLKKNKDLLVSPCPPIASIILPSW